MLTAAIATLATMTLATAMLATAMLGMTVSCQLGSEHDDWLYRMLNTVRHSMLQLLSAVQQAVCWQTVCWTLRSSSDLQTWASCMHISVNVARSFSVHASAASVDCRQLRYHHLPDWDD